ncbi:MAG: hypothetical protein JO328_21380 [Hyphomicrobiales bacterium]|nr:hypothetical protein [Hyphomicrobiales bacterium]MBV9429119.1 hypothetical protein [Bradyrhizobiaceae bacterium]
MRIRITSRAAIVILAGAALVPAAALARGGFAHGGHGPVFGFHHPPLVAHRPFRVPGVKHVPARFAGWWRLHRFAHRRGNNGNGIADAGYGGGYYPSSAYAPGDATGTLAPPPAVLAPPSAPSERIGCFARGYEVPGESGGVVRVTVTRC